MFSNWTLKRKLVVYSSAIAVGVVIIWRFCVWRRRRVWPIVPQRVCKEQKRELPNSFDISQYRVSVVEDAQTCEEYLAARVPSPLRVVGLDCEWKPTTVGRTVTVALLQLAFPNGECMLVRLSKTREVTPRLAEILRDKSVLKFGVGIGSDARRLAAGFGVETSGCVDLQHIALRCGVRSNTSLGGLAKQLLGVDLDKSRWLRCSNWEAESLSQKQINYAASDAIIALHILKALVEKKLSKEDQQTAVTPSSQAQLEPTNRTGLRMFSGEMYQLGSCEVTGQDWLLQGENYSTLDSLCQGIVDVAYHRPRSSGHQQSGATGPKSGTLEPKRTAAYAVRRTRLYHNCKLLAPDGQHLSTIDKRKVEWYLRKGLGTLVSESPMTVQLQFEPAGRPNEDRRYYLKQKENICVVCGTEENCVRKNIVPHEYRKHFPPHLKEHLSHDILLMCVPCHQVADLHNATLKQQLAQEFGAPLNISARKTREDPWLVRVRNHARALLRRDASIPECRRLELLDTVAQYCDCSTEDVTDEMVQRASEINPKLETEGYVSHAELVVSHVREKGQLFEFQQRWRQYFLDTMQPKFLPDLWCVTHNPQS